MKRAKAPTAQERGWNIYRCTTGMATSGQALQTIKKLLELHQENRT